MVFNTKYPGYQGMPSIGGLFPFLGLGLILGFIFKAASDELPLLAPQDRPASGPDLRSKLPTIPTLGQFGFSVKAVTRHFDLLRPYIMKKNWPLARGSDT